MKKTKVTMGNVRAQLAGRKVWHHALEVCAIIEKKAEDDIYYADLVDQWLQCPECSTVWLRDEVMEPLRNDPRIVKIGKQFNPTTEWDNTWVPLDSAIHRARLGLDPKEW